MNDATVQRLLQVNREFYARLAQAFAATRTAARVSLAPIMPYLTDGVKVLDVGCGNGRLAARIDVAGYRLRYYGVDASPALLQIARTTTLSGVRAEFAQADISARDWTGALRAAAPFDLALALAVLHHVPSFALRARVLRDIGALLSPAGALVMSNWQYTHSERLLGKVVPWSVLELDERELETGDALLDWKRGGDGMRYVHLLSADEVQALAAQSGLQVSEQFVADEGLNLYSVLRHPA